MRPNFTPVKFDCEAPRGAPEHNETRLLQAATRTFTAEVRFRHDRVDLTGGSDAGIVEQIVEPTRFVHSVRHGAFERAGVAHVEFDRMHLGAAMSKVLRQFLCPAGLTVGDPDFRTAIRQLGTARGSMPDAPPVTKATFPDTLDGIAKG
jgi:hypothetical protein